jgi:hypothetical protein
MMKVSHFGGVVDCKTIKELDSVLNLRYGSGVNEFLILGEEKYPYLAIMVNNEYATMIFFPKDEDGFFQSTGENTTLNPDETSVFYFGTPDQETQVWNEFVVPFAKAKEAAIEFFTSLSLPTCVEWSKL